MASPTLDRFLGEIARILVAKNGGELQDYLLLEPPYPPLYQAIVSELQQVFPKGRDDALENKCKSLLPEDEEGERGGTWSPFNTFIMQYFNFIRDVNPQQLVQTYEQLKSLLK